MTSEADDFGFADDQRWHLLRVKREWLPEWVWRALGQRVLKEPLRTITTRDARSPEEATEWWSCHPEETQG